MSVLRKNFSSVSVGEDYRIRNNRELCELFNDKDVAKRINQPFRWLDHAVRMDEDTPPRHCLMQWLVVIGRWDERVRIGKISLNRP